MPRTALAVQTVKPEGVIPAYTAANADGHAIANRGRMCLHVKNGGGSAIDVTLVTGATVGGRAVADDVVSVAAGAEKLIGPFSESVYNQSGGVMHVDFSAVTTVTVAAIVVP